MNDSEAPNRTLHFAGLLLLALAVRGTVLGAAWQRLEDDPDGYRQLAVNLVEQGTFGYFRDGTPAVATAYRPPLYPLILAAAGFAFPLNSALIAAVHLLFGVATVLLVYEAARRWCGARVGLAAAVLVTFDPILLNQSALVMTETLAAFLAVLAWICLGGPRRGAASSPHVTTLAAAGAILGLATLCRPTFLIWWAAVGMVLMADAVRGRRWSGCAAMCLAAAIVLAPWPLRNLQRFGQPILTTTHGGYTLWLGNNPQFYRFLREAQRGEVWDSAELDARYNQVLEDLGHDELAADRWARQQAMQCIAEQPAMFVYACAFRVSSLWGLVPHQLSAGESTVRRLARYGVGTWYAAVFLLAIGGIIRFRHHLLDPPWIGGLLLCLSFTAVHTVYWSNLRMRAPLMPVVCVAAAVGTGRWLDRRQRRDGSEGR